MPVVATLLRRACDEPVTFIKTSIMTSEKSSDKRQNTTKADDTTKTRQDKYGKDKTRINLLFQIGFC